MQVKQWFGGLLFAAALAFSQWDKIEPHLPTFEQEVVVVEQEVTEAQVWEALADWMEAGQIQTGTDELIRVCRGLKAAGMLKDISAVEEKYKAANQPVTAETIQFIRGLATQ